LNPYAIEVQGLCKRFGNHVVLDNIDLSVPKGTVFALLGPNGAGKTTLINILSTLVQPDSGSARIEGFDVMINKEMVRQMISLTGQYAAVDEMLTAKENLRMMGRLSGLTAAESRARANELLEYFDLVKAADKRVKTYSGGMRRRLDLAISLMVKRSVLFLDEPTTGLDTRSRRALWDIIMNLAVEGMTIFLTTQYLEEADQLANRIAVIADGKIAAQGTAEELKSRIGGEIIEFRNGNEEMLREIPTDGSMQELIQTLNQFSHQFPEGTRVSIRRPSMDDVFLKLTDKKQEVSQR